MLVVRDYASGWIACEPTKRKTGTDAYDAFLEFKGDSEISLVYSDNSKELKQMCRILGVPHRTSSPRYPRNNALAERTVRSASALFRG